MITGATFKRGNSKQDYATPNDFMEAVRKRYGEIAFDLAADESNTKATNFFSEQDDAFKQEWHKINGLLWLNPPFGDIAPWAEKCWEEHKKRAHILLLVPGSVGSAWFENYVHNKGYVNFLRPRLCFDGIAPYPKDCMLAEYDPTGVAGYEVWKWK